MVVAYVRLYPSLPPQGAQEGRVYALLLPSAEDSAWAELDVRPSFLGGFGAFPGRNAPCWADSASVPVLLPYLGCETVTKDAHTLRTLLAVLKGHFERVTLGEVQAHNGSDQAYVADGLFAVPRTSKLSASSLPLSPETKLLQVAAFADEHGGYRRGSSGGGSASACYLLAEDVRTALHLSSPQTAHLFDLLCAHSRHEHADRHLATHCATIHRKEEGYVLVNAHPGYADPVAITGMVNEPKAQESANMKMVQGYAVLLPDSDPQLGNRDLAQPEGAVAAWREHVLPPEGSLAKKLNELGVLAHCSERMVMYMTTRRSYTPEVELTVDYGKSYTRDYASGGHRPSCPRLYVMPTERLTASQLAKPEWPSLPGWFNPLRQPPHRPAFAIEDSSGGSEEEDEGGRCSSITVVPDEPSVVAARRAALGLPRAGKEQDARVVAMTAKLDQSTLVAVPKSPLPRLSALSQGGVEPELPPTKTMGRSNAANGATGGKRRRVAAMGAGSSRSLDGIFAAQKRFRRGAPSSKTKTRKL